MNSEMRVELANCVRMMMEDLENFSHYKAFCEARDCNGWDIRYSDVRNEVRDIVKKAVNEIGGYSSSFVTDGTHEYLEYFPINDEDEDENESDTDNCTDDCYCCSDDAEELTKEAKVDSQGRVFIPKTFGIYSGLSYISGKIYKSYVAEENTVYLSDVEIIGADKNMNIKNSCNIGMHVCVGKWFPAHTKIKLTAVEDDKLIVITALN